MKNMIKDAAILFIITLVAGCALGFVFGLTEGPIAMQNAKIKAEACKEVFADAASFGDSAGTEEELSAAVLAAGYESVSVNEALPALDASGNTLGYVITVTSHAGFGGDIKFSMGIKNDGTVNGISILSISETAGLGMNADSVLKPQFAGKNVEQFVLTKTGAAADNEIDAISGATITSDAVLGAANAGLYCFWSVLGGGSAS